MTTVSGSRQTSRQTKMRFWKRWRTPGRRRRWLGIGVALVLCVGLAGLAVSTATTRHGLNYQVSSREIPAYLKTIDFVRRHFQYWLLAEEITAGRRTDQEKVLAVFDWTRRNVRPTPKGWPIVDDHILNIIIRGHGVSDQMADVFATLSTYGGVPAFWKQVEVPGTEKRLFLAFAKVGARWIPFDVANGFVFRNNRGELAGVEELAAIPALVDAVAGDFHPSGIPYRTYLSRETLLPFRPPEPSRTELQMPWPRLRHELQRLIGRAK